MAPVRPLAINGYSLSWSILNKTGGVYLHFTDNEQIQIPVNSVEELAALADILRSSPNVSYQPNGELLITAVKPPGT